MSLVFAYLAVWLGLFLVLLVAFGFVVLRIVGFLAVYGLNVISVWLIVGGVDSFYCGLGGTFQVLCLIASVMGCEVRLLFQVCMGWFAFAV